MTTSVYINRTLFAAYTGLVASGYELTDARDLAICQLAESIRGAQFPPDALAYFGLARGANEVNPYWPRGSDISAACFFIKDLAWDSLEGYLRFLRDCGHRPLDAGSLSWISRLPEVLSEIESHRDYLPLKATYEGILYSRLPGFQESLRGLDDSIRSFTSAPFDIRLAPNLLQSPHVCDYVQRDGVTYVVEAAPDRTGPLHEFLHPFVGKHREMMEGAVEVRRLASLVDPERMKHYGYMWDYSPAAIVHAIEESIVRALSLALADLSDSERESAYRVNEDSGFLMVRSIADRARMNQVTEHTVDDLITEVLLSCPPEEPHRRSPHSGCAGSELA